MKTGRMAPVRGQLNDGALTPTRRDVCERKCAHIETAPPPLKKTLTGKSLEV